MMRKWRDFIDGKEPKKDLESLLERIEAELNLLKPHSVNEEIKLNCINELIIEARLKLRTLKQENIVLKNKVSILEEDLNL
jgi:hypothetical protein